MIGSVEGNLEIQNLIGAQIQRVSGSGKYSQTGVVRSVVNDVTPLRQAYAEFTSCWAGHRDQLPALLFAEFDRFAVCRIDEASNGGGNADVVHQPDPLSNRSSPDFLISPADLRRPVRSIVIALSLDAYRKRAHHLARANAIKGRPVVALAIHQTRRERIPANKPLRLSLGQVFCVQISTQFRGRG